MRLFPRLRTLEIKALVATTSGASLRELEADRELLPTRVIWPPTGGTRITLAQASELREAIREVGRACGYVRGSLQDWPTTGDQKRRFDALLSRVLHQTMGMSPHEAADGGVWAWVALVVAPELVRWRFGGEKTVSDRFGQNRAKNVFARCWWRAEVLRDTSTEDPYYLVEALGEDELVQLVERARVAGYRPLSRALASGLLKTFDPSLHRNRSHVFREALQRMVRWLGMLRMEALEPAAIDEMIFIVMADTFEGLGYDRPSDHHAIRRAWTEVSLERRYRLVVGLTSTEVSKLFELVDPDAPSWREKEHRWQLLHQLRRPCPEIIAALGPGSQRRLAAELGASEGLLAWLQAAPAGDWSGQVESLKGFQFSRALSRDTLFHLREAFGWTGVQKEMEARNELLRRYGGDVAPLLALVSQDECERLIDALDPSAAAGVDARRALRSWLTGAQPKDLEGEAPLVAGESATKGTVSDGPPERPSVATKPDAEESVEHSAIVEAVAVHLPNDSGRLSEPLSDPPTLLHGLFEHLQVRTVGEALNIDVKSVASIPRYGGPKRRQVLERYQADLRQWLDNPPAVPVARMPTLPAVADLNDLEAQALSLLDDRARAILTGRWFLGQTLRDLGTQHRVSRERARQIADKAENDLRALFGSSARSLAEALIRPRMLSPHIGHATRLSDLSVPFDHLVLPMALSEDPPDVQDWHVDGDWLLGGLTQAELEERVLSALRGRMALSMDDLESITKEDAELTPALVGRFLADVHGWSATLNGELETPATGGTGSAWLEQALRKAGRPVHQAEMAVWLLDREAVAERDPDLLKRWAVKAERLVDSVATVVRCGAGEFQHVDSLPFRPDQLDEVVGLCVSWLNGESGAVSTKALLTKLEGSGHALPGLNPHILKDALGRHPAVRPLRKFQVASAASFREDGLGLKDRLVEILASQGEPMRVADLHEALPEDTAYARTSVAQAVSTDPRIRSVGRGLYALVTSPEPPSGITPPG